jgi:macrolide transport system ATP-binding/permease protein
MTVDATFLETIQIPILLGRGMESRDVSSPRIAVVYVPYTQNLKRLDAVEFELRTVGNPLALANAVRQIVHQASAAVPVSEITTQRDMIDENISQERTFADLCACFALLALLIACVGLYGTMAYTVARRTSEIGVRMALGAERRGIVWMVLREVLVLAAVGLAIGLTVAWQTAHFVASSLFGMKPNDPVALALSVVVLTLAAVVAGYAPARRASRIDPMFIDGELLERNVGELDHSRLQMSLSRFLSKS